MDIFFHRKRNPTAPQSQSPTKAIGNTDAFPYINECFIRFAPLSFLTKKFCWKSESINLKETFFTTLRFVLIIPKGARPILHTLRIIGIPHYPSMLMTFSCKKLHSNWCWQHECFFFLIIMNWWLFSLLMSRHLQLKDYCCITPSDDTGCFVTGPPKKLRPWKVNWD